MAKENKYRPDIAIPPGETLLDILENIKMTQAELAEKMGRPNKTINEIIKGKAAITPETALQLEAVLKTPARFWNNLEMNYQETLARIAEQESLKEQSDWLKSVPLKRMIDYGWVKKSGEKTQQLKEVLGFFNVASVKGWEKTWNTKLGCVFRKSAQYEVDKVALSAWLRQGQIQAGHIPCEPFSVEKFREVLSQIRQLSIESPDVFVSAMQKTCARAGVAVVFVRELPKVPINGVTYWLNSNKAVIQLSLRYKSNDQLWFSFFHEAGHILKHGKRDFYEGAVSEDEGHEWEKEADRFAADFLVASSAYAYFVSQRRFDDSAVIAFSQSAKIAPGIVVGRLQHDGHVGFDKLNHLKKKYIWDTAAKSETA